MKRINKKSLIFPLLIFILTQICLFNANPVKAAVLDVQLKTDRQTYNVGDPVLITANATLDGNPYSTVIAIEVTNPDGNTLLLRTIKTGNVSGSYWKVIITDLFPCDSKGNPKTTFKRGTLAYASYTVENIDVVDHEIKIAFHIQCSDNTPMLAYYAFEGVIEAGKQMTTIASFPIPSSAPKGEAKIFLGIFDNSPKNGGTPYCPEKTASFYIESTTPSMPNQPEYLQATFSLPRTDVKLGNYTVYAAVKYYVQTSFKSKTFQVILLGDLVKDGLINMKDIVACINLFFTTPNSPNWNPDADIDKSGRVDMKDIVFVVQSFGKSAIY
jgi:hypothetical protein